LYRSLKREAGESGEWNFQYGQQPIWCVKLPLNPQLHTAYGAVLCEERAASLYYVL